MKIAENITRLIGRTPLLALSAYKAHYGLEADVVAKLEMFNPMGSVKDRAALFMLEDAERGGLLKKGGTVVEPTSGNTGIALACLCAVRGYRLILVMPESMSAERRAIVLRLGAELELTPAAEGMGGSIGRAARLAAEIPGAVMLSQFENPANATAHRLTTGPEIYEGTGGRIDFLISAVGTGGTITGTGEYLKGRDAGIKVVAVEPAASPVLSGGRAGTHGIQGIGAGFVPAILNRSLLDEVICVGDEEAFKAKEDAARLEGIFAGISSGAALSAAKTVALRKENRGKTVVVILPDTGERYLSSGR